MFLEILNKIAPVKVKVLRFNNNAFMTKSLKKSIMLRSRIKNNFNKQSLMMLLVLITFLLVLKCVRISLSWQAFLILIFSMILLTSLELFLLKLNGEWRAIFHSFYTWVLAIWINFSSDGSVSCKLERECSTTGMLKLATVFSIKSLHLIWHFPFQQD